MSSIYVTIYNPCGIKIGNRSYFDLDYLGSNNINIHTDFNSALSYIKEKYSNFSIDDYDENEPSFAQIIQFVIGNPITKIERIIDHSEGVLVISFDKFGNITKYKIDGYGNCIWTPIELKPYANKFKCGDIVDYVDNNGIYQGKFVVVKTPSNFQTYLDTVKFDTDIFFTPGYTLWGNNPYTVNGMDWSYDLTGMYNENLKSSTDGLYADFYHGLSIYGKCFSPELNISTNDIPITAEGLYTLYFKDKNYEKFQSVVLQMNNLLTFSKYNK